MNKHVLKELLIDSIIENVEDNELEINDEFPLMGNCQFDSFDVVSILSTFEMKISDKLEKDITLSSDKAMSMKHSPFANITTLINFAYEIINE